MGDVGTVAVRRRRRLVGIRLAVRPDVLREFLLIGVREVEEDGQPAGRDEWRVDLHGDGVLVGVTAGADVYGFAGQLEVAVDDAGPQIELLADGRQVVGDGGTAVGEGELETDAAEVDARRIGVQPA